MVDDTQDTNQLRRYADALKTVIVRQDADLDEARAAATDLSDQVTNLERLRSAAQARADQARNAAAKVELLLDEYIAVKQADNLTIEDLSAQYQELEKENADFARALDYLVNQGTAAIAAVGLSVVRRLGLHDAEVQKVAETSSRAAARFKLMANAAAEGATTEQLDALLAETDAPKEPATASTFIVPRGARPLNRAERRNVEFGRG